MKNSLIITLFFLAGILSGRFIPWLEGINFETPMQWALSGLMLFVGLAFGSDPKLMEIIRSINLRIFILPLITIAGTFAGIAVYLLLFHTLKPDDAFAVASGFGYYSLSSLIIDEFSGTDIAIIALLANVLREIITLLFTPLITKYFGNLAPICSAGATSMDTTLPVIVNYSGKKYLVLSLFHGIFLTLIVPFLITIIYKVF